MGIEEKSPINIRYNVHMKLWLCWTRTKIAIWKRRQSNWGEKTTDKRTVDWSWFGFFVLWHINLCRLFNAKATLLEEQSSSCSSYRAISMDIPDPLSPPLPIVHCFWQFLRATSSIGTELLYVCSSWSSCLCLSMWRGPQEYITYELVPTSPACLVRLILIVFMMDGRWPYSSCFVGCCLQDLFNIAHSILV